MSVSARKKKCTSWSNALARLNESGEVNVDLSFPQETIEEAGSFCRNPLVVQASSNHHGTGFPSQHSPFGPYCVVADHPYPGYTEPDICDIRYCGM